MSAEEAIFVGDHPMNDVQASRNAGLQGIWKRNEHIPLQVDADWVIDDCGDLWKLIRSL
ncbi:MULTISPECIES: HAD family hydrolase [Paenibacillus]|uniref:hypothetical protein n=1 Tax=Paenibacillus TaxID=44249 RepID=UPI001140F695|nr:hypothetical protein [Paenibacillus odorifer]MEC0132608.1 hypothetical protein [Paenibacillus odorifer]MEC0224641.1 hypothetical protein [Paenibacillus odorifer]